MPRHMGVTANGVQMGFDMFQPVLRGSSYSTCSTDTSTTHQRIRSYGEVIRSGQQGSRFNTRSCHFKLRINKSNIEKCRHHVGHIATAFGTGRVILFCPAESWHMAFLGHQQVSPNEVQRVSETIPKRFD